MDDVKSLILDKARDRFERFGFKKTTMDELSKDCRISKKTIYEHFSDKEYLFRCLLLRECRKTIDLLFGVIADVKDPLDKLVILMRTAIEHLNEEHLVTKILNDKELFAAFVRRQYHEIVDEEIITLIAGIIKEGKDSGQFRDVNETVVAYAGFKLFQSFSYARTAPLNINEDYTDHLADFYIHALVRK